MIKESGFLKKFLIFFLVVFVIVLIVFFSFSTRINPGEVAIKVDMYGSDKGVESELLYTGRNFYNPFVYDIIKYQTYIQQKEYKSIQFQDVDGMILGADVAISYKFSGEKISKLYEEYRKKPEQITNEYFPTWIRNAMVNQSSQMKVDEIYGVKKEEYRNKVREELKNNFIEKGIIIEDVYFTNGVQIPEGVRQRIDDKIKATQIAQQKENELAAVKAEAEKRIAEEEGKAKSRIIESESRAKEIDNLNKTLTSQYLEFRKLEIQQQAIEKWNGIQPNVVSGSNGMILDIGAIK